MKKGILILFVTLGLGSLMGTSTALAQSSTSIKQASGFVTGGHYNSRIPGEGSLTPTKPVTIPYAKFPLYSPFNGVSDDAADTFRQKIAQYCNTVYTWVDVDVISGSNTGCTLILERSGDTGVGKSWQHVQTYTLTGTTESVGYQFNSWGATNLRWRFNGAGTHASGWKSGIMLR